MNVRFADRQIRFRVAQEELERLLSGRSLALDVSMPRAHKFRASVSVTPLGDWQLDSDPTGLWLSVPRAEVEQLAQDLPRKEGLEHDFEVGIGSSVAVALEVDVRQSKAQ
jgi:hypothetical protein